MTTSVTAPPRSAVAPVSSPRPGLAFGALTMMGLLLGLTLALLATAPPAQAHGNDETKEGYLLVQQALGHLAHDTTPVGIDLAMEKVNDAIAAPDHHGVAMTEVGQAKAALEAGRVEQARTLLQDSIKAALSELPPAVGNQTGTTLIVPELPGRADLTTQDWLLLACSLLLMAAGVVLAYRFRPKDSVAALRRQFGDRITPGQDGPLPAKADGSQ